MKIRNSFKWTDDISHVFHGAYFIEGFVKYLPHFITNNLSSLYVCKHKRIKGEKQVNLVCSVAPNKIETLEYSNEQLTSINTAIENDVEHNYSMFFDLSNPISIDYRLNLNIEEKKKYLNAALCEWPEIDQLSNKIVITGNRLLKKAIEKIVTNTPNANITNTLKNNLIKGNMHHVLSRRMNNKEYSNVYISLSGSKQYNVPNFLSIIKRGNEGSNDNKVNINSRTMQPDYRGFICPITIKEMKDAGKDLCLTKGIRFSKKIDDAKMIKLVSMYHSDQGRYIVCLYNRPTIFKIEHQHLLNLKRHFSGQLTFYLQRNSGLLHVRNCDDIPLAYSYKYNIYVSPSDVSCIWPDAFEKNEINSFLSTYGTNLNINCQNLHHLSPGKQTVAITNIKNRAGMAETAFDLSTFVTMTDFGTLLSPKKGREIRASLFGDTYTVNSDCNLYLSCIPQRYHHLIPRNIANTNHCLVQVVHGNYCGFCDNDGIILSQELVDLLPNLMCNVTLSLECFKNEEKNVINLEASKPDFKKIEADNYVFENDEHRFYLAEITSHTTLCFKRPIKRLKYYQESIYERGKLHLVKYIFYYKLSNSEAFTRRFKYNCFVGEKFKKIKFNLSYFRSVGIGCKIATLTGQKGVVTKVVPGKELLKGVGMDVYGQPPSLAVMQLSVESIISRKQTAAINDLVRLNVLQEPFLMGLLPINLSSLVSDSKSNDNTAKIDSFTAQQGMRPLNVPHTLTQFKNYKKKLNDYIFTGLDNVLASKRMKFDIFS